MQLTSAGAAATEIGSFGFGGLEEAVAQAIRPFKLVRTTETRNTCPYCSVSCGVIMHSLGDKSKNAKSEIIHIEGGPDNPVNRGTFCPKVAGLLDFVSAKIRLRNPIYGRTAFHHHFKNPALLQHFKSLPRGMKGESMPFAQRQQATNMIDIRVGQDHIGPRTVPDRTAGV